MIVDTSALMSILLAEDDALRMMDAIAESGAPRLSAATLVEASIVAGARNLLSRLDEVVGELEVVAFDGDQAQVARAAYARFGKGSGSPARLNFGDCMAYALAMTTGEPLLFKGDDFTHTDVVSALG